MTAQELRIGNIVEYNSMYLRVSEIYTPKPRQPEKFNNVECIELHCDGFITATMDEISPIPLTEEILLKCGAAKKHHKVFTSNYELPLKRNKSLYITDVGTPNFMVGIVERDFETNQIEDCVNIHNWDFEKELHLHQLQNLFYSLTQTELEIKL